jgi:hypothetical protein
MEVKYTHECIGGSDLGSAHVRQEHMEKSLSHNAFRKREKDVVRETLQEFYVFFFFLNAFVQPLG